MNKLLQIFKISEQDIEARISKVESELEQLKNERIDAVEIFKRIYSNATTFADKGFVCFILGILYKPLSSTNIVELIYKELGLSKNEYIALCEYQQLLAKQVIHKEGTIPDVGIFLERAFLDIGLNEKEYCFMSFLLGKTCIYPIFSLLPNLAADDDDFLKFADTNVYLSKELPKDPSEVHNNLIYTTTLLLNISPDKSLIISGLLSSIASNMDLLDAAVSTIKVTVVSLKIYSMRSKESKTFDTNLLDICVVGMNLDISIITILKIVETQIFLDNCIASGLYNEVDAISYILNNENLSKIEKVYSIYIFSRGASYSNVFKKSKA